MVAPLAPLSTAVIDALEAAGLLVGDGRVPEGAGWQGSPGQSTYVGYVLLADISGGQWRGTIGDRFADLTAVHQGQCVGATAGHARAVTDTARAALAGMRNTVTDGRKVDSVRFDFGTENTLRDDDVQPPVWYCPLRVRLLWTPA